jgi:tRNA G46 methylase TrmB
VTEALRDDLIVAAPSENQWSKLKDLVPNATFLEIGSGMTAFSVAALNSSSTVVAVITTGVYITNGYCYY